MQFFKAALGNGRYASLLIAELLKILKRLQIFGNVQKIPTYSHNDKSSRRLQNGQQ
jgi:hypothetical protein